MFRRTVVAAASAALLFAGASTASAAVLVSDDGTGFVGKGDIQTAFGWNNQQLQQRLGDVQISVQSVTEQTTEWVCFNERNENEQERERTTTTSTQGVVEKVARERNQITGIFLTGWDSAGVSTQTSTEGPKLESCPNANSTCVLDSTAVGDPETVSGGVFATYNGVTVQIA